MDFVYREIELPVIDVTAAMMERGVRIDSDRAEQWLTRLHKQTADLIARVDRTAERAVDVTNNADLRRLLFEELELTPMDYNNHGPTVDDRALASLSADNEIAGWARRIRGNARLAKYIGTSCRWLKVTVGSTANSIR
jgi:DNA polymerase I-like protein with 3'-5' exonuclease and polymerase domains